MPEWEHSFFIKVEKKFGLQFCEWYEDDFYGMKRYFKILDAVKKQIRTNQKDLKIWRKIVFFKGLPSFICINSLLVITEDP